MEDVRAGGMVRWLIEKGVVKDGGQATYLLLGIAILLIVLAILIYFLGSPSNAYVPLPSGTLIPGPGGTETFTP